MDKIKSMMDNPTTPNSTTQYPTNVNQYKTSHFYNNNHNRTQSTFQPRRMFNPPSRPKYMNNYNYNNINSHYQYKKGNKFKSNRFFNNNSYYNTNNNTQRNTFNNRSYNSNTNNEINAKDNNSNEYNVQQSQSQQQSPKIQSQQLLHTQSS